MRWTSAAQEVSPAVVAVLVVVAAASAIVAVAQGVAHDLGNDALLQLAAQGHNVLLQLAAIPVVIATVVSIVVAVVVAIVVAAASTA